MSKSLYVKKYYWEKDIFPNEIINVDDIESKEFCYIRTSEKVPDYIKNTGFIKKLWTMRIDIWKTIKTLTGDTPTSVRFGNFDHSWTYEREDGTFRTITKQEYDPYYYRDEFEAYVYKEETIVSSDDVYFLEDIPEGLISLEMVNNLIRRCVSKLETGYSYGMSMLYALEKARLLIEEDNIIVFDID